jgi:prepilin-type N-terminal cleavage/methylation domain-containing protein
MAPAARTRDAAFTLLEILAVVAIFALLAGLALPNFSGLHARNLKHQARRIVAQIELARQRAIVTGTPHRLFIDIDGAAYRIESDSIEDEDDGDEETDEMAIDASASSAAGGVSTDLTAPRAAERAFRPLPGSLGRFTLLDESIAFAGIETGGGWVDGGETFIRFERDGSADATTIVIEHESGMSVTLEVLPLADTVRVRYETL